ncbi:hypothetical protein M1D88_05255 [Arthrobacter sp. R1-13]
MSNSLAPEHPPRKGKTLLARIIIDVRLPDGSEYSYVIRANSEYCASLTPGATISINKGEVANPIARRNQRLHLICSPALSIGMGKRSRG